jgi:sugar lactone lactonase YvrE
VATRGLELLAGSPASGTNFWGGPAQDAAWRSLTGVTADDLGNVYFSEGEDHTLRKIAPDGQVSVLAGFRADPDDAGAVKPKGRLYEPAGLSINTDGSLLLADLGTHTLKTVAQDGTVATFAGTLHAPGAQDGLPNVGLLTRPKHIATHRATGISLVTEDGTNRLVLVNNQGQLLEYVGHGVQSPSGVAFDPDGNAYVLSRTTGELFKFAPTNAPALGAAWTITTLANGFNAPEGLALAALPNGTPYLAVADTGTHRIIGVSLATGARRAIAGAQNQSGHVDGPGLTARFDGPTALAQGSDGTLFVVDQDGTALRTVAPDNTVGSLGHGNDEAAGLGNVDGQGEAARFFQPRGIAVDSHGNAYVANPLTHTIRRIDPDGTVTTVAGTANTPGATDGDGLAQARFNGPAELALDAQDILYISEPSQDRIRTYDPATGQVATFINAGLGGPGALAWDADGNLLVADRGSRRILAVTPQGALLPAPMAQGIDAAGLAVGGDGSVYATVPAMQGIKKLTPPAAGGAWTESWLVLGDRGALDSIEDDAPEFNGPEGITLGPRGNLYVADTVNGLIRCIAPDGKVSTLAGTYPDLGAGLGLLPGTLPQVTRIAVTPKGDLVVTAGNAVYQITAP